MKKLVALKRRIAEATVRDFEATGRTINTHVPIRTFDQQLAAIKIQKSVRGWVMRARMAKREQRVAGTCCDAGLVCAPEFSSGTRLTQPGSSGVQHGSWWALWGVSRRFSRVMLCGRGLRISHREHRDVFTVYPAFCRISSRTNANRHFSIQNESEGMLSRRRCSSCTVLLFSAVGSSTNTSTALCLGCG